MYLVGLHMYCKMIHGPYNIKLIVPHYFVSPKNKIYFNYQPESCYLFCICLTTLYPPPSSYNVERKDYSSLATKWIVLEYVANACFDIMREAIW